MAFLTAKVLKDWGVGMGVGGWVVRVLGLRKLRQHKKCEGDVRLDGVVVLKYRQFRYLGLMFHENGMINEDVTHRTKLDG